jgi:Flp pilus assembly protein protease CpaA
MLEIFFLIALGIAFTGSLAAGLWDLRTTDIPDEITFLMIVLGPAIWLVYGSASGNFAALLFSLLFGSVVLGLGWLLYLSGKWGGGDAALLAGIFYLLPDPLLMLAYTMNLLIVSLVYSVGYAVILGLRNPRVFSSTKARFGSRRVRLPLLAWLAAGFPIFAFLPSAAGLIWLLVLLMGLFAVYGREIEKSVFRRKIRASELRVGMVLAASKTWTGASAEDVARLRKKGGKVAIKDGVRFGLVFFLTLAVTVVWGNLLIWIIP